jgi:MFS family permease
MATLGDGPSILLPTRVRFGVLGFACSLSLITYLDRICIMRVKEDIQDDLSFSDTQMGLVFSAFVLGYALFEIPGGWMGDLWGPRRVLTRIVFWWSAFTALTGSVGYVVWLGGYRLVLGSFGAMLLVRFLFGAGEAGAYPNLTCVVRHWFPFRERALAQGSIWMSARLGGAIAPVVIGRLAYLVGWRQAFGVLGLIGLAWGVLYYLWFRDTPEQMPSCNDAERDLIRGRVAPDPEPALPVSTAARSPDERVLANRDAVTSDGPILEPSLLPPAALTPPAPLEPEGHVSPPARVLAGSLTMWCLCVVAFAVSFGWYFYPTWQPKYLKDVHGISYEGSELLTGLPFLCGAVGSLAGGRLSDVLVRRTGSRRWGRSVVGVAGFIGAGACVFATGFVAQAWQAVLCLCLAFFINDLAIPVIWAVCADVGGRYVGTVAGVMNMSGGFGALLSPTLTPVILAALPAAYSPAQRWRLIFVGLAGAWFVGAVAWVFINAARPLFRTETAPQ